eukprot:638327-Rhodomonas_salina.1
MEVPATLSLSPHAPRSAQPRPAPTRPAPCPQPPALLWSYGAVPTLPGTSGARAVTRSAAGGSSQENLPPPLQEPKPLSSSRTTPR